MMRVLPFLLLAGCATVPHASPHDSLVGEWEVSYVHGPKEQWARAHDLGGVSLKGDGTARLALCERTRFDAYDIYCDAPRGCFDGKWRMEDKALVVEAQGRTWRGNVNFVGGSRVWFAPIWGAGMEAATLSPAKSSLSCDTQ